MAIQKRCIRCRKPVREDGTCQNPNCVRYVEEKKPESQEVIETVETSAETEEA